MATEIRFPKLGLTMREGTFLRWLKALDDKVVKGEPLFEVENEKVVMEIEAPASGFLVQAQPEAGEVVPVGQVIGLIAESKGDRKRSSGSGAGAKAQVRTEGQVAKRIMASPVARRLAEEAGLDLQGIAGSGPKGRITKEDVERAVAAGQIDTEPAQAEPADAQVGSTVSPTASSDIVALAGIRRTIAERMAASAHTTAPVTLTTEVDATELVGLRDSFKRTYEGTAQPVPTYNDIVIKVAAMALRAHPGVNARLVGDEIHRLSEVNVGLAVDVEAGLYVPVVRNADVVSLGVIATETKRMVESIKQGTLVNDDLQGGAFTITNLGAYGIDAFTPIINPPECAVLGVGRIIRKPVVWGDEIIPRPVMTLSLTFDHRLVDGAPAARFLQDVGELVAKPHKLLI